MRGRKAWISTVTIVTVVCSSLVVPDHSAVSGAVRPPIVVDSALDQDDLDFPGGNFDGASDNTCDTDSGAGTLCTLRAAIQHANVSQGRDKITFAIDTSSSGCSSGTGICTIGPATALPEIAKPVTIDGYTQPGAAVNTSVTPATTNAVLKIQLAGFDAGLQLGPGATNSLIKGLAIGGCLAMGCTTGIRTGDGSGYRIEGNFIGPFADGVSPNGNIFGLVLDGSRGATVGGTSLAARNIISGNALQGVYITGNASKNTIQGNLIGLNATGGPLANSKEGVLLVFAKQGNRILSNSIFANAELGIDLSSLNQPDGVTANDLDDSGTTAIDPDTDTGPNGLQNSPTVTGAVEFPTGTSIGGELRSLRSTADVKRRFLIQLFVSPSADASGSGEGRRFIGEVTVTTDDEGFADFSFFTDDNVAPEGTFISATATEKKKGNTSEFSNARVVEEPVIGP